MAERFLFFDSVEVEPDVYDREYRAQDFAEYFGSVLTTGLLHKNQVPDMGVTVEPGTMNVVVEPGKAIIKGHLYENTSELTLTHSIPESNADRVDRIVLRLDLRNQSRFIRLFVKEGTASSNPTPPELQRDDFIHELSLAQIRVRQNTVQLLPEDLFDERPDPELCGLTVSLISIPPEPDHLINASIYRSEKDRDYNFARVERKRPDGTLLETSELSQPDSQGLYKIRTVKKYSRNGLIAIETIIYDLHYDSEGYLISEVLRND